MSGDTRRRRRDSGHKPNHERWMISYADLLTLLLAVFIVLYATSAQNTSKLKAMAASMMEAFSGTPPALVEMPSSPRGPMHNLPNPATLPVQAPPTPKTPAVPRNVHHLDNAENRQIQRLTEREQRDLQPSILAIRKLRQKLSTLLQPEIDAKMISVLSQPLSIKIRLNAKILFDNGKADLTKNAVKILTPVAKTLSAIPPGYQISIHGYTDNQPIHTRQFPSNWQLSSARALSVLMLFRTNNVSGKALSVEGFSKYHPLATNDTAAGREQNRRVSIVITAPKEHQDGEHGKPVTEGPGQATPQSQEARSATGKPLRNPDQPAPPGHSNTGTPSGLSTGEPDHD